MTHVVCGSIAILAACLQIWPWLRQRYPDLHRRTGQIYVFAGVLPAGAIGLVIGALTPFGPVLRASNVLLAHRLADGHVTGYRAGRQYRLADHRRWMIRSVVLTLSIITQPHLGGDLGARAGAAAADDLRRQRGADGPDGRRPVRVARLGAAAGGDRVVDGASAPAPLRRRRELSRDSAACAGFEASGLEQPEHVAGARSATSWPGSIHGRNGSPAAMFDRNRRPPGASSGRMAASVAMAQRSGR